MNKQEMLLADIRELTVEMAMRDLDKVLPREYLRLCVDILKQVRDGGIPGLPVLEYMKNTYGAEKDNDGQTVFYVDEAPFPILDVEEQTEGEDFSERCPSCGEPFEVQVEDGADCLNCVAGREDPDEYIRFQGGPGPGSLDAHQDPDDARTRWIRFRGGPGLRA